MSSDISPWLQTTTFEDDAIKKIYRENRENPDTSENVQVAANISILLLGERCMVGTSMMEYTPQQKKDHLEVATFL